MKLIEYAATVQEIGKTIGIEVHADDAAIPACRIAGLSPVVCATLLKNETQATEDSDLRAAMKAMRGKPIKPTEAKATENAG